MKSRASAKAPATARNACSVDRGHTALTSRVLDAELQREPNALAWFDAGYLAQCFDQQGILPKWAAEKHAVGAARRPGSPLLAVLRIPTMWWIIAAGALQISARAGDEGKLFGSVTAADIAEAVTTQTGVIVDRRDVHLEEPIRSIGTHEVSVKLFHEVEPVITVEVVPEG